MAGVAKRGDRATALIENIWVRENSVVAVTEASTQCPLCPMATKARKAIVRTAK